LGTVVVDEHGTKDTWTKYTENVVNKEINIISLF